MKLLCQFLLVILGCSLSTALQGRHEVEIKSIVSSLFEQHYDSQYSPPPQEEDTGNSSTTPQPTVVHLSVKNFRPLGLLSASDQLLFAADIVAEYVDRRLSYEPREGIKYVDVQAYGGHSVWSPSLTFPHSPISNAASPGILLDDDSKYIPKVLAGPQGQIYRRFGIYRELRPTATDREFSGGKNRENFQFTLEITEDKHSLKSVQLRWKDSANPIQFEKSQVTLPNSSGGWGSPRMGTLISGGSNDDGSCTKKVNLGYFGDEEFSCVQASFSFNTYS